MEVLGHVAAVHEGGCSAMDWDKMTVDYDARDRLEPSRYHDRGSNCTTPPKRHREAKHPKAQGTGKGKLGGRYR